MGRGKIWRMQITELICVITTTGLHQNHNMAESHTVDGEAKWLKINRMLWFTPPIQNRQPGCLRQ